MTGADGATARTAPAMRVVLDALPLQVRSAGIAAYTDGLVRSLAAQHPEVEFALFGLPARLLGERGGSRAPYPANVRWITTLAYPLVTGTPIMGLPRLVRLERVLGAPTLYHATNYAAPRARAVPLVLTVHDLALLRAPELGTGGRASWPPRRSELCSASWAPTAPS